MKQQTTFLLVLLSILVITSCENTSTTTEEQEETIIKEETSTNEDFESIEFPSLDSLMISANLYEVGPDAPTIILCHQARFNKFEYAGIAPKLKQKGFNCLAIDQRSGGPIVTYPNETTLRATQAGKPTDYLDAEQDIKAAVAYAYQKYQQPVILWGSSYSSTLVLYLAVESDKVQAVVSFSPGNYFANQKGDLVALLSDFDKPFFLTSSKREAAEVATLIADKELNEKQVQFQPSTNGFHGSRALWAHQPGGEEYWTAIDAFLAKLK